MTLNILFAGAPDKFRLFGPELRRAVATQGLDACISADLTPDIVDYVVFEPTGQISDFSPFARLKAVLSLWAGVEDIVTIKSLKVPLARMADSGLKEGMVEWVLGHTLRHHLGIDTHVFGQDGLWRSGKPPPLARSRKVSVLGLGALGSACATALHGLGFDVAGWSRTAKDGLPFPAFSGQNGLAQALRRAQILVLLLPHTPKTTSIINAASFAQMQRGCVVINPGRGPLINDKDLLSALDTGHVAHATLDVFATEPLPADHRYWAHPRVTVTPHIASATRPDTASDFVALNISRFEAGLPLLAAVNRLESY